ncbi:hypothetical protein GCM10027039_09420 [Terrabacter koreensis]
MLLILWLGAPSDPRLPGAAECDPDPFQADRWRHRALTVARIGLSLAAVTNAGLWAGFWEFKRRRLQRSRAKELGRS